MTRICMLSATVHPGEAWRLLRHIKGKRNARLVREALKVAHGLEGCNDENAIQELQLRQERIAKAQEMVGGLQALFFWWDVPDTEEEVS